MTYRLDQATAAPFLDDGDQRDLIRTIQSDALRKLLPSQVEAAQEALVHAFLPAIRRAARQAKVQDHDDAFSSALEEFLLAVRDYDTEGPEPFHAKVKAIGWRVAQLDSQVDTITIPHMTSVRYWRLLNGHGGDAEAAYAATLDGVGGMEPATFLAVHHVIGGMSDVFSTRDQATLTTPGPEERLVEAWLVEWLFTLVTPRQELILKLRFGFTDDDVEDHRLAAGYPQGLDLSDVQTAHAAGIPRTTMQREKARALATMREAMQRLVDEEEA